MKKTTILIVEDEAIVAADLAGKLERLGYQVAGIAVRGGDAIEMADRLRPRLVLMDIQLDGPTDGVAAAEAIRNQYDVPVIYLTAHSDAGTLARARITGPFGFILKPFDERDLATQIEMALYRHGAELQVRQSEIKYRTLFESIDEGFCIVEVVFDTNGKPIDYRFLEVNPAFERQTGLHDAVGKRMRELVPRHEEHWFEIYGRIALTGKPERFVNEAKHLGNRWYGVYAFRMGSPDERKVAILFMDISEQRRAEQALLREREFAESEHNRLRAVLEALPVAVIIADADGKVIATNPAVDEIWGQAVHSEQMVDYATDYKAWWPATGERVKSEEWGMARALSKGEHCIAEEMEIETLDGRRKFILNYALPIRDAEDRISGGVAINVDITDRKQDEAALRESEERFRLAAKAAKMGAYSRNLQTGQDFWSPDFLEIYGAGPEGALLITDVIPDSVHPEDRQKVLAEARARFDRPSESGFHSEHRIILPNGGIRWVMIRGQVEFDKQKRPLRTYGFVMDITDLKQAEKALRESNQELNEYAYALTHNIKAPFRAVENYTGFLLEDLADTLQGEPKQYLEGIKKAVTQANNQFKDLEALYHIRNYSMNGEQFEMRELLDEIESMFKASGRKVNMADRWPVFRGAKFLLRQILINLVDNAFKYNRADLKKVEVGWQKTAESGIEIFVRDNGIGIEPRYQAQIFQIFKRLHAEREFEGTGIGLAIVKRAVQNMKGTLRVESEVGRGSTFYVNLPNSILQLP